MDDPTIGNFGPSSKNGPKIDHSSREYDQKSEENRAKSLMHEILSVCQKLRLVSIQIFEPGQDIQDLKQKSDALKQKISSLCHDLESVKSTLTQAMEAMEANAQRLESQPLNDPAAELELRRAARAAWIEVERLKRLIKEIDEVLSQAAEAMTESDELPFKSPLEGDTLRFNERQPQLPSLDNIMAGFDAAHGIPSLNHGSNDFSSLTYDQAPPLLGGSASSGLETSLRKIPAPSVGSKEIHADPYTRGLYVNDAYYSRRELSYDPYSPVAGAMATGAQYGGSIMAQAGFDGSYMANGPGGVSARFQQSTMGGW